MSEATMNGRIIFLIIFFILELQRQKKLEKYYYFLTILGLKSLLNNRKILSVGKMSTFPDNLYIPLHSKFLIRLSASLK